MPQQKEPESREVYATVYSLFPNLVYFKPDDGGDNVKMEIRSSERNEFKEEMRMKIKIENGKVASIIDTENQ